MGAWRPTGVWVAVSAHQDKGWAAVHAAPRVTEPPASAFPALAQEDVATGTGHSVSTADQLLQRQHPQLASAARSTTCPRRLPHSGAPAATWGAPSPAMPPHVGRHVLHGPATRPSSGNNVALGQEKHMWCGPTAPKLDCGAKPKSRVASASASEQKEHPAAGAESGGHSIHRDTVSPVTGNPATSDTASPDTRRNTEQKPPRKHTSAAQVMECAEFPQNVGDVVGQVAFMAQ